MRFKCTTDIEANEEIFTNYGQNYFEWGNAACLCASCEQYANCRSNRWRSLC